LSLWPARARGEPGDDSGFNTLSQFKPFKTFGTIGTLERLEPVTFVRQRPIDSLRRFAPRYSNSSASYPEAILPHAHSQTECAAMSARPKVRAMITRLTTPAASRLLTSGEASSSPSRDSVTVSRDASRMMLDVVEAAEIKFSAPMRTIVGIKHRNDNTEVVPQPAGAETLPASSRSFPSWTITPLNMLVPWCCLR